MAPLWTYYVGSDIRPSSMGTYGGGLARIRRRRILNLVSRLNQDREERREVQESGGGGLFGTIGNIFGTRARFARNLGSDLFDVATGVVPGAFAAGKAVVQDIAQGPSLSALPGIDDPGGEKSNFERTVWDPIVEGLKQDVVTLGELATGRPERFIEHPLSPLLTLGAGVSGGATALGRGGGAVARIQAMRGTPDSNLGRIGQRLSRITSTTGRPETLSGFTRRYSPAPAFKMGQILSDRFAGSRVGNRLNLPILQDRYEMNRFLDRRFGQSRQESAHRVEVNTRPIIQSLNRMSPEERVATIYALRGINTPDLIERYQARLADSVNSARAAAVGEDVPDAPHIGRLAKDLISPDAAEVQIRNLSNPTVVQYILNPTDEMRSFGATWDNYVRSRHEPVGITPEVHEAHIGALQRELDPNIEDFVTPEGGMRLSYVPDMPARDMAFQEPRRFLGTIGAGRVFGRNPRLAGIFQGRLRPSEPLRNPQAPYIHSSSMETVLAGGQRTDPRVFVDHIRRVEDDLVIRNFNAEVIESIAFKGDDGGTRTFRDVDEMNEALVARRAEARAWGHNPGDEVRWDPRNWVLVPPDMPIQWYRSGQNAVDRVIRTADAQGIDINSLTRRDLERLLNEDAEAFWSSMLGATRRPGVAIPKPAFRRIVANIDASRPYGIGVAQYARVLNTWRSLTLAYMPRWLINTAVGSTALAIMKGNVRPRNYMTASRLARNELLPPSVRLGGVVKGEALFDDSRVGRAWSPVTQGIFKAVQNVEDFFRQSGFVQSLDRAARQKMAEEAIILDKWRPYIRGADFDEYIDDLIRRHPDLVQEAIEDVDRFAYNFTSLSPFERRWLRLLIPFWGWYKFITKFAYRLPVAYPGRTLIMAAAADIAEQIEEEQGPIPPWISGSLILGRDRGILNYMPTLGLNPLSQFANPARPEGAIAGLLGLGQLSPVVQAGLTGLGINTLDAGEVPISPQEGVARDYTGQLVDIRTGEPVDLQSRAGGRRFLRSLLTSVPQVRLLDLAYNEGQPSYPEAIPLIERRPMPVQEVSRRSTSPLGILGQFFGIQPRRYDIRSYQRQLPKRRKYARTIARRQLRAGR